MMWNYVVIAIAGFQAISLLLSKTLPYIGALTFGSAILTITFLRDIAVSIYAGQVVFSPKMQSSD